VAYPKLTGIIIALILVSMFAGIFAIVININPYSLGNVSGVNMSKYDKLNQLSSSMQTIKTDSTNIQQQSGTFDLYGGFFANAWKVLSSIPQQIEFMNDMVNQAILDSSLGEIGVIIKQALEAIIFCLIFVGIIIAALIKWVL
jgi:hypothetical protein